ncbi:hypothetical protein LWI28_019092 [Acer negundo]|uniref:Nucleolar 27S pre-rRNA processing Urb2/Npa2 C-terminal domain-containing protein n=1 Tax=Acer negundo TaxID=4023 RepID=A0AAD5J0B1_ACENE|nr:hypothetical protein LWI28_019092 [Acer negundo]
MVDLTKKKKNKRKQTSQEDGQKPSKTHRIIDSTENELIQAESDQKLEEGRPWRNLKLILSIQNKEVDLQKKVELAFDFVNSRVKGGNSDDNEEYETVKTSRLIVFLSDWVQSLLISAEKKVKVDGAGNESGVIEACLDFRCWVIFKFCLENSLKWRVSLSFSKNLLRAIGCIARNALPLLNLKSSGSEESFVVGEGFELYSVVLDCVPLVFSSQGGLLNENLDLWVSTVDPVLELVLRIYSLNLNGGNAGAFAMQFSCSMLDPFAKFLRVHPTRKNGFRDFVDKLLEPLMHLLGILLHQIDLCNHDQTRNLLKLVEEVLSHGLFHPTHIDGFLGLHNIYKYLPSEDGKSRDSKMVIKSYHRHLFDKVERIMAAKKVLVLNGMGQLFHLLVDRVKMQKGASALSEDTKMTGKTRASGQSEKHLSGSSSALSDYSSTNLNAETRKSLFEFFAQIMEPLLIEMNGYVQAKLVVGSALLDLLCTLKSINTLLASFLHEKVYVRTEDITEGASLNFLKKVHGVIMSFASYLPQFSNFDKTNGLQKEIFTDLAKELFTAVGYFLDIDYEVIGDDLVSLWFMMFSYLSIGLSFVDVPNQCLLTSQILDLGCQLVNLYSELRQVNNSIFALCKAVRLVLSCDGDGDDETSYNRLLSCMNSLPREAYTKSVGLLLCSQEFKLSFHNAIKSIPEGQASGCIRQLAEDISESLKWMKENCAVADGKDINKLKVRDCCTLFDLQAEFLGRYLSELYALVLDSLIVTTGNSNLLGISIKDLMILICPCISNLLGLKPDSVNEFLFSVTGRTLENGDAGNRNDMLKYGLSTQWVFVFFFRLFMCCRSLYRQAISLMPPDTSKKMSAAAGDSFTAYSGKDWMEKIEWIKEGYFSWIVQPSASLLDVIHLVSDTYLTDNVPNCCPLIYVLHAMTLQRLVDLNRQIKSLEYLLQNNDNAVQFKLLGEAYLSQHRKRCKKWKRHISVLNQEAAGLTDFMMGYVSLVTDKQLVVSSLGYASFADTFMQEMQGSNVWNLCVCAIDEKSLPTAIWWIVSQNIDIWCAHAASKKLKMFLSLLIRTSLPCVSNGYSIVGKKNINEAGYLKKVTVHQISTELLSDSFLYEHKFVRRHLASRFCHILEKSALSLFSGFSIQDVDFSSSPNWTKVLDALENSFVVVSGNHHVTSDSDSVSKLISHSFDEPPTEMCKERKAFQYANMKFTACKSLLNLLCWMPKGYLKSKSLALYATHILNLERIVISSLLQSHDALSFHDHYEFLRLFVSCRRTLKYIIMASCEEKTESSQVYVMTMLCEESVFVLWLFKSVFIVIRRLEALSDNCSREIREMVFSLMDHTSYILLALSKYHFSSAINSFTTEKPCREQPISGVVHEHNNLNESDLSLDSSKDTDPWKIMFFVVEGLEEQAQSLLMSLKGSIRDEKLGVCAEVVTLNKLSSVVSCFSGILWGLASAINHSGAEISDKVKLLRLKCEPISKLNHRISAFADFISSFLRILVVEDNQPPGSSCDAQSFQELDCCRDPLVSGELLLEGCNSEIESSRGKQHQNIESSRTCSTSSNIDDDSRMADVRSKRSPLEAANGPASFLAGDDLIGHKCLNRHLLQGLLKGDHPEAAFLLRQLFIAASAILRLNLQISSTPSTSRLVPTFIGISEFLLLQLVDMVEVPQPFTFVWLDGILRYLEELGSHFASTNPSLTRNLYTKLVELHVRAIGKCISLQGKKATLASHETESSTKVLNDNIGSSGESLSQEPQCLDEFKARLRTSFKVFISKSSDLHLLSAVQCIERALVGVKEGCTMIYEINTGGDGGKVSTIVAAGIDCLDLILEHASGRKRLNVVKRHIQNLIAALFNIIVHLQSQIIFYGKLNSNDGHNGPDSGSVILMCIEVLTRVSSKHALFELDSWHVAQSLRIPAALFQDIHQLRLSEAPILSKSEMFLDNQNSNLVPSLNSCVVDRQFTINVFAACCKLLYTILKHHKNESQQCIALLEESVRVLLQCLETVDIDLEVRKGYFTWEVQEGIKCACFLRRIYEEVKQQKDVFGRHSVKFLSNYIWIYSGFGPQKTGIRREIDEALRPGVYALIESCSADDLQYLHTVFGEGPCRNTLATLQHDYKLNFRYEGKV